MDADPAWTRSTARPHRQRPAFRVRYPPLIETDHEASSAAFAGAKGDVLVVDRVVVVDMVTPVNWVGHTPTGSTLHLTMAQTPDTHAMSLLIQHTPYCVKETLCQP